MESRPQGLLSSRCKNFRSFQVGIPFSVCFRFKVRGFGGFVGLRAFYLMLFCQFRVLGSRISGFEMLHRAAEVTS